MQRDEAKKIADAIVAEAAARCSQTPSFVTYLPGIIIKHLCPPKPLEWEYCHGNAPGRWIAEGRMHYWIEIHPKGHFVYGWRNIDTIGNRDTFHEAKAAAQAHYEAANA